jgi:hypothetical protein
LPDGLTSNQAAFLGDPKFPTVAINSTKGGQIRLYESLYKQYSRLQFSRDYDKPFAIAGLEQRLIRAFETQGAYGVFERYFGRSLLWQLDDVKMERIEFPPQQQFCVPTWSWMAYKGGIAFMDLPFGGVDWEQEEIRSPWTPKHASSSSWHGCDPQSRIDLAGVARDFSLDLGDLETGQIVFDGSVQPPGRTMKCVVIGRQNFELAADGGNRRHYVLIVAEKLGAIDNMAYERVGAGFMPGSWIRLDEPGLKVRIF